MSSIADKFGDIPTKTRPRTRVGDAQPCFELKVIRGADQGSTLTLDATLPRALIGQSPACELRLTDPTVSRRHASVELAGERLRLTDRTSTNGTIVQQLAVFDVLLEGGEHIQLGDTTLEVVRRHDGRSATLSTAAGFGRVIGESAQMRHLYPLFERLAASKIPVVIEGETGTGKEVLAESLHEMGPRAKSPFAVFDCTAVAPTLLEAALFGYEKGAFTGAVAAHRGIFEEAHGGTLLIDEVGDLDLALQAKLLRALERSEVRRVGGDRWLAVDVRVIAATRRDLDQEIQSGRFRDDLFFRLAVARVELPPLRKRQGDVALLARHFWTQLGGRGALPQGFVERLELSSWPGNVRELHNTVARELALGDLASERFTAPATQSSTAAAAPSDTVGQILEQNLPLTRARELLVAEFERRYVTRVLQQHGGNVTKAAAASGIARRYFQQLKARQKP